MAFAGGFVVLLVTGIVFWNFLPRDGKLHRFVNTEWEPYIGVGFTSAIALGLTLLLSGTLDLLG